MLDRNSFVPLYHQLASEILGKIEAGDIKPGDKLPSESEMIQEYNIGRPTIRMALSLLVNDGYLEKVRGRGTFCKSSRGADVFLNVDVILDMADVYFIPYYMKSISEVLVQNHCNFIVSDSKDDTAEICSLLQKMLKKGTSGVIFQPSHRMESVPEELHTCLRMYRNAGIPYLMIDSTYDVPDGSYIVFDERKGGAIAAEYLHGLGHRRVLAVHVERFCDSAMRVAGFQALCSRENLPPAELLPYRKETFAADLIHALQESRATAVFGYNDEMAVECIKILREHQIRVPEDISVMGFDDSVLAEASMPPLTTIIHPKQIMGELAAKTMIGMIHKQIPWPYTMVFAPTLIERVSCARRAGA